VVGQGQGDAVAQCFVGELALGFENNGAVAFIGEMRITLAEGANEAGLAVDVEANLFLIDIVGVQADGGTAFGPDSEVAGLTPSERFYNFANAGGGRGRFQHHLPQFQQFFLDWWGVAFENGRYFRKFLQFICFGHAAIIIAVVDILCQVKRTFSILPQRRKGRRVFKSQD
jgi:hypothetical protein